MRGASAKRRGWVLASHLEPELIHQGFGGNVELVSRKAREDEVSGSNQLFRQGP